MYCELQKRVNPVPMIRRYSAWPSTSEEYSLRWMSISVTGQFFR